MSPLRRSLSALHDRGDVVRTAALVGVPLLLVIVVWACWPRPYYTGTNSIRTRAFVTQVKADRTLCVRDLQLPARTGLVEFDLLTASERPALRLALKTPAGATIARSRLPRVPGAGPYTRSALHTKVAFEIPQRPAAPATAPVIACVTPERAVEFGGTLNIGGVAPTLDGRPLAAPRIAVWFRPPAGSERSLAAQLPTVFERASLFRPSWVGPWTFYLLLGLVLPLAFGLALYLLARASALSWRRLGAGVFAVALLVCLSWALVTPPFQAPDEQDHFAYVQQLAENGEPPDTSSGRSPWSGSLGLALEATHALSIAEQADGRMPWLARDERAWARRDRGTARTDGGGATPAATHGPVYFGALTVPYRLTADASIWSQLTALRIGSGLLAALAVLFVLLAAREIAPAKPVLAVGAALFVAFNPMFTFIGASVNNDVGYNALAALLLWLALRALRRGLTLPLAIGLGVTLGVLPVIKGTAYAMYVVALLVVLALLVSRRDRRTLIFVAATAAVLVLVQLGWGAIAAQFDRTTLTTPGGGSPIATSGLLSDVRVSLSYIWQIFLPPLPFMLDHYPAHDLPAYTIYIKRAWASFGWYAVEFPALVYGAIIGGLAAIALCAVAFARRRTAWLKANWLVLLTLVLMPVIVILAVEHAYVTSGTRALVAEMGRYLFPAVGALAILGAGALWAFGERWAARLTSATVVCLIALTFASQLLVLRGFYT